MWLRWENLQQRLFSSDGKINSLISICYCRISILFANFFDCSMYLRGTYLDILFNIQAACTSTNSITKAYDGECAAGNFNIQRIQKLLSFLLCFLPFISAYFCFCLAANSYRRCMRKKNFVFLCCEILGQIFSLHPLVL